MRATKGWARAERDAWPDWRGGLRLRSCVSGPEGATMSIFLYRLGGLIAKHRGLVLGVWMLVLGLLGGGRRLAR